MTLYLSPRSPAFLGSNENSASCDGAALLGLTDRLTRCGDTVLRGFMTFGVSFPKVGASLSVSSLIIGSTEGYWTDMPSRSVKLGSK